MILRDIEQELSHVVNRFKKFKVIVIEWKLPSRFYMQVFFVVVVVRGINRGFCNSNSGFQYVLFLLVIL